MFCAPTRPQPSTTERMKGHTIFSHLSGGIANSTESLMPQCRTDWEPPVSINTCPGDTVGSDVKMSMLRRSTPLWCGQCEVTVTDRF